MANPDSPSPSSPKSKTYATIDANKDLRTDLGGPCRLLRVGQAGDLALEYADGTQDTISNVQVGEQVPAQAVKILLSGTTAAKVTAYA